MERDQEVGRQDQGASAAADRATRASPEPVSAHGLGHSASVPCAILEHYSASAVRQVESRDNNDRPHWCKPYGLWVSVKGEDDWPAWCNAEEFGIERLGVRHLVELASDADILWISGAWMLQAFDQEYGYPERIGDSGFSQRRIDWRRVALRYDGIVIAPYVWEHRLDGQISDWYYSWDCASGCIWNAQAIAKVTPCDRDASYARDRATGLGPEGVTARAEGIAQ